MQTFFFNFNFGHDFNFKLLGATNSTNNKGLHVLLHQTLKQILMFKKCQHHDHFHCLLQHDIMDLLISTCAVEHICFNINKQMKPCY
jgi:hypothetical protein